VISLGIFSVVLSDKTMCPGVDSAPENEYQAFLSWGKGGRCVELTTYHPCSALIYPEPLGPPRPVAGDLYFTFT